MSLFLIVFAALLFIAVPLVVLLVAMKTCPPGMLMLIVSNRGVRAVLPQHGRVLVLPFGQAVYYLDLAPVEIKVAIKVVHQGAPLELSFLASVAVSGDPGVVQQAAERLVGLGKEAIARLASDIVEGCLRLMLAEDQQGQVLTDNALLLREAMDSIAPELRKIGIDLLNIKRLKQDFR